MVPEPGYQSIMVDPSVGRRIGELYTEAESNTSLPVRLAYAAFVQEVRGQFAELRCELRVSFTDDDPYADSSEMFADVKRGRLAVYKTQPGQDHPLVCAWDNNRFRAVHDFYGHYMSGRGFDRHGEEAAWVRHSRMFTGLARRAMTTETRGQSSAFIWVNGGREFPVQKSVLLPEWVSVVPERWI